MLTLIQWFHCELSRMVLAESIPLYMKYDDNATFGLPMYKVWKDLLAKATNSVDVASFYWTLTGPDIRVNSSTDQLGRDILEVFKEMPSRNVSVRVAVSSPSVAHDSTDLDVLQTKGVQVRMVNFGRLTKGILHTKLWVVDMKHIYIGSANMDWRALTQVKELGAVIYDCPLLAQDLQKIFQSYWVMGDVNASIPDPWPPSFDTSINRENPLLVNVSGVASRIYISGSPPSFCPNGRTRDLDAILSVIKEAEQFIDVAVMEYFPTSRFTKPQSYWPVLDDALKKSAFERQVPIRLLVSCGRDTDPAMLPFLKSLNDLQYPSENISIEVRLYIVPVVNQSSIPYARVNHNKYMVTDKVAYIGTSNWSADYFNTTAGIGLVVSQDSTSPASMSRTLREQMRVVFERDWNSQFAVKLSNLSHNPDCTFAGLASSNL
uniref:Phospholipase D family member 4 n=1 Tax=Scleropages formosus TaxID=113540 RepID=A0A8C9RWX1_SCLFO